MGLETNQPVARGKPRHRSTLIVLTPPTDVLQRKSLNSSEEIVLGSSFVNPLTREHRRTGAHHRGLNPQAAGSCRAPWEGTAGLSRRLINKACHRRHARAGN